MSSKTNTLWVAIIGIAAVGSVAAIIVARPFFQQEPPAAPATSGISIEAETSLTSFGIEHVDESTFLGQVLESDVPVLVDFYAEWCGPCKQLAPVLDELAGELQNARIVKVNVDENPALSRQYGVSSIPNLLVFRDGRVVANHLGLASKEELKVLLTQ